MSAERGAPPSGRETTPSAARFPSTSTTDPIDAAKSAGRTPPAPSVGLRTGSNEEVSLLTTEGGRTRVIGTVDGSRVYNVAHEGAVYLHQGRQWQVERLDVADHAAWLVDQAHDGVAGH